MAKEPLHGFPKKVQKALLDGDYQYALRLFQDPKYHFHVVNMPWDLIPVITEHLTEIVAQQNPEFFKGCVQLLNMIAVQSNVEEVVLELVSEIEDAKNDTKFNVILDCLPDVIQRITENKAMSLNWILNSILLYMVKSFKGPIANYMNLEGLELSEPLSKLISVYNRILFFFESCESSLDLDSEMKDVVCRFLVELLGHPFSMYNIQKVGLHQSELLTIATPIIENIFKVLDDPLKQVDKQIDFDSHTTAHPNCVGNLLYLVYVEGICYNLVPKVYQHTYLVQKCAILFNSLKKEDDFVIKKTLCLCTTLMLPLKPGCISYLVLDNPDQCDFFKSLTNVIIYNDHKVIRKAALDLLKTYLTLLDTRGFYQVTLNLFNFVTHSGLQSFLISVCKDRINEGVLNKSLNPYFQESKLSTLLKCFCRLENGEQADLMQNSDQIIGALNLLRYLAIVEGSGKKTGFWHFEPWLKEQFMEPLRRALELSRAHYNLEIKTAEEAISSKTTLPGLPPKEKLAVLYGAITAFDVMESLLSRVTELILTTETI